MKALSKKLELLGNDYYKVHLNIVNSLLPIKLTPKEVEVLALFMSLKGDIGKDRFGPTAKKLVKQELSLSDGGLSNYVKALKQKGFISTANEIPTLLIPNEDKQEYYLQIINKEVNDRL
jgi:hypothetical protein